MGHPVADRIGAASGLTWWGAIRLAAAIFIGIAAVRIVWTFGRALAVLVLSITIADAFEPLVRWAQRRVSRTVAAISIYLTIAGLLVLLAYFMIPAVGNELNQLESELPDIVGGFQQHLDRWLSKVGASDTFNLSALVTPLSQKLVSLPMTIATAGLTTVLVIFLSFYWLLASPSVGRFFRSLFPEAERAHVSRVTADISRSMGGYLRGVALNALATGGLTWLALFLAGVNYSFALGAITALGEFFPYIGPILSAVPAVLVALLQSPSKALITLVIYVGVQQVEGHLLTPNIMRSQTDIPRPLVIIALFAGGAVGGLLGAIVAIPVAGAANVCVEQLIAPQIRKRWQSARADS